MANWLAARSNNKKVYGHRDNSTNECAPGRNRSKDAALHALRVWQLCMPISSRTQEACSQVTIKLNQATQSCVSIIRKGAVDDIKWLRRELHATTNTQRQVTFFPYRWKHSRHSHVLLWCQRLGAPNFIVIVHKLHVFQTRFSTHGD
mmetsp:Transcript_21918/g.65722  ORF Transcript_21918/g.65722 Transcript_21918/m.65722 type:complete len:147 (+) Transcript_21918:217-657(+)